MDDLDSQVGARVTEAKRKRIHDKASAIANRLGKDLFQGGPRESGARFVYEGRGLYIQDSVHLFTERGETCMGISLIVKYREKTVYEEGGLDVRSYIPGRWERTLNSLYVQAKKRPPQSSKEAQKTDNLRKQQDKELKARFKL